MRPCMRFIKENLNGSLIGAMVGVYDGRYERHVLEKIPRISHLYLIDPYEIYDDWDKPVFALSQQSQDSLDRVKNKARELLKPFNNRITWIYKKFENPRITLPNLDFVYIDGNHLYSYVKKDIEKALRYVRKRGVVGGHDFWTWDDVNKAVIEYAKLKNIRPYAEGPDWWFVIKDD